MTLRPMLATLTDAPFDSKEWLFEVKWDGYRALAHKNKTLKLLSRNGLSFNERYPTLVKELERLPGDFVIDGEIVIFDRKGISHFQLLQNYLRTKTGTPYFYVFDMLSFNGVDMRRLPLIERKKILKKFLSSTRLPHIKFSAHVLGKGKSFFQKAVKKGWEGILAKKADSAYQSRRSRDWLKVKTGSRQELVIGGFTAPKGARKRFGALLVGFYERGKLRYAGHVGGGFSEAVLDEVYAKLKPLASAKCPFTEEPHPNMPVTWVKPKLVCEVEFTEWTSDGKLRHPVFKGLRMDKAARSVVREKAKKELKG